MVSEFCDLYAEFLDGKYDCVDRIVLNAYFPLAMSGGGFRTWWRALRGGDDDLDNARLMRFSGRFSRRIRAYAGKQGIPLIALSTRLQWFFISDLGAKMREILRCDAGSYSPRQAAYDLRKLRGKEFVVKLGQTRRYTAAPGGLRSMMALHVLREKVIKPLLAGALKRKGGRKSMNRGILDEHYEIIQTRMQQLFQAVGIAA